MAQAQNTAQNAIETITITNFRGALTRIANGDLNSGFAKFNSSYGYDPFSKPMNLTWLEQPVDITNNGPSSIQGLVLAAKTKFSNGVQNVYAVSSYGSIAGIVAGSIAGSIYKIQPIAAGSPNNPSVDTSSLIGTMTNTATNFTRGASMELYNTPTSIAGSYEQIFVGHDLGINYVGLDGSNDTFVGSGGYVINQFRPLKKFVGKLLFGNGNTIGAYSANTGTVTSSIIGTGQGNLYSELNPALSVDSIVHDLDISVDGNYALITSSGIDNEYLVGAGLVDPLDIQNAVSSDGQVAGWNGLDPSVTQFTSIPSYAVTALQTYLGQSMFFSDDAFGSSLNDGTNKILTLPGNKSPLPNATATNGNFLTWCVPEIIGGTSIFASMYYYGSLDQENPPGLWRMFRLGSTLSGGYIYQVPLNLLVTNKYTGPNSNKTGISIAGYGKHYFSVFDQNASTNSYKLYKFLITPSGSGVPQGVYETQTQLFSQKITVKAIRVYCEPTVSGNGFGVSCIGMDGNEITNGTFTYNYSAGTDLTLLQGSLDRIDFKPEIGNTFALGIQVFNVGSKNMTIKKIEVDYTQSGK